MSLLLAKELRLPGEMLLPAHRTQMTTNFSRHDGKYLWNRYLRRLRITLTSAQTSITRLRTSTPTVIKDRMDTLKKKDSMTVKAAPTIKPEGDASDAFGTDLQTLALKKYCRLLDVQFQQLFATLEIKNISVQVGTTLPLIPCTSFVGSRAGCTLNTMFLQGSMYQTRWRSLKACGSLMFMLVYSAQAISSSVGLELFAIEWWFTLLLRTTFPQTLLRGESSSTTERPSYIHEIRPTSCSL